MKTLFLLFKILSLITGAAALQGVIPAKYAPLAVLVFALASTLKDIVIWIGDWLDDGQINKSFQPDKDSTPPPASGASTAGRVTGLLVSLGVAGLLFGCAAIQPGSRAVVVRAEQSISVANATFDSAVRIDNANRAFFRTNAPAFHEFCEWLRRPVTLAPLTNSLPRGLAICQSANAVKLAYKRTNSTNDYAALINSLAVVEAATAQAQKFILQTSTK